MTRRASPASGRLFIVATPLGNLGDMSPRAVETLRSVDAIASEDTRRTRKLLAHFAIATPLFSYHEHNEERTAREVVRRIEGGESVALVADAGTPLIADPGYRLVALAVREGIEIVTIPGPSAVVAALSVSGLPPMPFFFAGFLPRKAGARKHRIEELGGLRTTIILFESPHRIAAALRDLAEVLGDRAAVLARELTKVHEEVIRGRLRGLAQAAGERAWKGEIVIVVSGDEADDDREGSVAVPSPRTPRKPASRGNVDTGRCGVLE
jgi:16S rRNA (cytidine1402-2'-O)-methyltransferase